MRISKILFLLLIILLISTVGAYASGGGLPFDAPLKKVEDSITGPFATVFSLVGIVGAGAGLVLGANLDGFLQKLLMLVLAISLLIGGTNILSLFNKGSSALLPNYELIIDNNNINNVLPELYIETDTQRGY